MINDGVASFLTTVEGATSLVLTGNADQYVVRYREAGVPIDTPPCVGNPTTNTAPAVDPIAPQTNLVSDVVSLQVVATDVDGDTLGYQASGLPAGLTIDPVSGLISGTLTTVEVATVTVTVDDGEASTTRSFQWTVTAPIAFTCSVTDGVLSWTDLGVDRYFVRQIINGTETFLAQVDGATSFALPGNADQYVVRARPGGVITNTPPCEGNPIAITFECQVTDGVLSWTDLGVARYSVRQIINGTETFLATVDNATSFVLPGNADEYVVRARIDGAVIDTAPCVGNPVTVTFDCVVADGILSWTDLGLPRYSIRQVIGGNETFLATVEGATSLAVSSTPDEFVVRARIAGVVTDARCANTGVVNTAPTITPIADQTGRVGDSVTVQVVADDVDGDALSYSATGLPAGLTIDPTTGAITGDLSIEGQSSVQVTVDDGTTTTSETFTWDVLSAFTCLVEDREGTFFLTWTDQQEDRYQLRQIVDGADLFLATVDGIDGGLAPTEFELTTPLAQTYIVRFNLNGVRQEATCQGATAPNAAPVVAAIADQLNSVDDVVTLQVVATDADEDPLAYSATGLPPGLTIDLFTGEISGSVDTAGTSAVIVTVDDGTDTTDVSFTWTVEAIGLPPLVCMVEDRGGVFFLTWTDQQEDRYQVRQIVGEVETFLATVDGIDGGLAPTEFELSTPLADTYVVRFNLNGVDQRTECPGTPPLVG